MPEFVHGKMPTVGRFAIADILALGAALAGALLPSLAVAARVLL